MLAFYLCFPSFVFGSKPNLLLGQRMGETLRKMDPSDASLVQAELLENEQALNNPAVLEATGRMNRRVGGSSRDDICDRDYDAQCPLGWSPAGAKCVAPKGYVGGCKTLQSFVDMDEVEKRQWAESCNSEWECKDQCQRDYARLCPESWTDVGGGFCEAPQSYSGDCLQRYKTDMYSVDQKERLASVCSLAWPCVTPCSKDYTVQCPTGWAAGEKGMCLAPSDYAGPCDYGFNASLLDAAQKAAFGLKCVVEWPCAGGAGVAPGTGPSAAEAGPVQSGPVGESGEVVSPQAASFR